MLKTHVPLKIQSTQTQPAQIMELSVKDLEVIVGGSSEGKDSDDVSGDAISANHNETLIHTQDSTQSQETELIELSVEDLAAIVGGMGTGGGGSGCTPDDCGENHNETIISVAGAAQTESTEIIELSEEDLEAISGGIRGDGCTDIANCGLNHNETLVDIKESTQAQSTQIIELSVEDLAAIAGGGLPPEADTSCPFELCGGNHNETIISVADATQSKSTQIIELSEEDLEAIAGGIDCPPDHCGVNHNEMMVNTKNATQSQSTQIIELSEEELAAIAGGFRGEDPICPPEECGVNHNETLIHTQDATQSQETELIELSVKDLTVIVGGNGEDKDDDVSGDALSANHNETVIDTRVSAPAKQQQPIELSVKELAAIVGGTGNGGGGHGCLPDDCGHNHNETLIYTQASTQSQETEPIELSVEDLEIIVGGTGNGGGGHSCLPDDCSHNHNETLIHTQAPTQSQETEPIELSVEDLEAIAGGFRGGTTCPEEECGVNHNETLVDIKESAPTQSTQIINSVWRIWRQLSVMVLKPALKSMAFKPVFN